MIPAVESDVALSTDEPFELRDCPGRGVCMFSKRRLRPGDLVLREAPAIVMPDSVYQWTDMDRIEKWLERVVTDKLPEAERRAFFELCDSRNDAKTPIGIFFTNDMSFCGDAGLFLRMARVNHACQPNADFISRPQRGVQDLVCTRDIFPGDEVNISYMPAAHDGSDIRNARRHYTRFWYGFQCTCHTCLLQGSSRRENELLRLRIREIQYCLEDESALGALSLSQLDDLISCLQAIDSKVPYLLKVLSAAFAKAVHRGDFHEAARYFARAFVLDEIIHAAVQDDQICAGGKCKSATTVTTMDSIQKCGQSHERDSEDLPEWDHILASQFVTIQGRGYMFPPMPGA